MAIVLSGSLILSGSIEATGGVTISGSIASASYAANASTASYVANAVSSSYSLNALTSSNAMTASSADSLYVRSNVVALGTITAQTLNVQQVTSSVEFITGSTKFGTIQANTHEFTGSLGVTGSQNVNGYVTVGSSTTVTDSHLLNIQGSTAAYNVGVILNKTNSTAQIWGITNTGPLAFYDYTNSSERVRIGNNGKVSIGSNSTSFTPLFLSANGAYSTSGNMTTGFAISNGTTGRALNMGVFDSGAYAWIQGAYINNADTAFALALQPRGGNVGIGTTSTSGKLHVKGDIIIERSSIAESSTITMENGEFDIKASPYNYSTRFFTGTSGTSAERMRITSGGKVAIGQTDSAYGIVAIKSNNTTAYMGLNVYANGNGNFIYMNHNNNVGIIGTEFGTGGTGHTDLTFQAGGSERFRITTGGSFQMPWTNNAVNIMNYDDNYRMGFLYQANSRALTLFSTGGDGNGNITFNTRGTVGSSSTDYGTERMRINSSGYVGIGTSSPGALLHVQAANNVTGTILVRGGKSDVTSAGEINSKLDFGGNDTSVFSDNNVGGRIASVTEISNGAYVGMAFYTYLQGRSPDLREAMRINSAGDLLIGSATKHQVVTGAKTAASSGSAMSIAYVGHTNAVKVFVYIYQSTGHIGTGVADITTAYGSGAGGITTSSRLGNISSFSVSYNNAGYYIDVLVNYSGAAPTIYWSIEGLNDNSNIYAL